MRAYVERRLAQTDKFLESDPVAHAQVECEYQEMRHGERYRAEFTLKASHAVYRAELWAGTLHEAIDLAINQLVEELREGKQKRVDVFRRTAARVKDYLRGFRSRI